MAKALPAAAAAAAGGASASALPGGGGFQALKSAPSAAHAAADAAAAPIFSGEQSILATVPGGGHSVFGHMGSAPGTPLTAPGSAPVGYEAAPYQPAAVGAGQGAAGGKMAGDDRLAAKELVPGAAAFPGSGVSREWRERRRERERERRGSGGGWAVGGRRAPTFLTPLSSPPLSLPFPPHQPAPKQPLYATNDEGTGPAHVGGGGFQPLGTSLGGAMGAPLGQPGAAGGGLTLGGGAGGAAANAAPAQQGGGGNGASSSLAAPLTGGGGGGGGLPLPAVPGGGGGATVHTTAPGGLPLTMTLGRRRF